MSTEKKVIDFLVKNLDNKQFYTFKFTGKSNFNTVAEKRQPLKIPETRMMKILYSRY